MKVLVPVPETVVAMILIMLPVTDEIPEMVRAPVSAPRPVTGVALSLSVMSVVDEVPEIARAPSTVLVQIRIHVWQ